MKRFFYFNGNKYKREPWQKYFHRYFKNKMVPLHREVWEYYKGSIPDGFEIHHKDFNRLNNDISNLECLSKKDHCLRHTKHKKAEPINSKEIFLTMINRAKNFRLIEDSEVR